MSLLSEKLSPSNSPPASVPASQSTQQLPLRQQLSLTESQSQSQSHPSQQYQQPQLVCKWSAHAPQSGSSTSPFPRYYHALSATATAAGELFLFGGYINTTSSDDLYVISTRDFSTTLLRARGEVPSPRGAHYAALTCTDLLIWGGKRGYTNEDMLDRPLDDSLRLLNLASREWTRIVANGPGPGGRYHHTVTVVGSMFFVFGGQIGGKFLNDMWALDLNSLKSQPVWESYEPTPGNERPFPRTSHVSVTTEDHIIVFGGYGTGHYYNDTWLFNISTRKWTELQCTGSIPSPRAGHAAVLVGGVIYVFGGFTGKTYLNDLYALQLSTQRWFIFHNGGTSPLARSAHAMASDGTRVFVLGGYMEGARSDAISLIHVFDTQHIKYPESAEGEVARLQLERQLSELLAAQTERDHRIAQLTDELALKNALLEKAEANAVEAARYAGPELREHADDRRPMRTSPVKQRDVELVDIQARLRDVQAKLDELLLSRDQQIGKYEKELANVRVKLEAKESVLEAVRLRLAEAEKGRTKGKDILRAQTAAGSVNADEDQVIRRLVERMRAMEVEMESMRRDEKSIEAMECRNEG